MSIAVNLRLLRYLPLLLVLLICSAGISQAVPISAVAGFDGSVKTGTWAPVIVKLSNNGAETVEGKLIITQEGVNTPSCFATANLPPHSKKQYTLYSKFQGYGGKIQVTLQGSGGNTLGMTTANLNMIPGEDRFIVTIGSRMARLSFLSGETIKPRPGNPNQAAIHAGSIPASDLPDRPAAYSGPDVIVISEMDPSATDPKALQSIAMWVAAGGTLVVSGGPNYQKLTSSPFYDDLLPVRIQGAASAAGLGSLSALVNKPFPTGAASIAKAAVKPGIGKTLAAESGIPIIVARKYGAGRVIFLAFDPLMAPFRDWSGAVDFWKNILAEPQSGPTISLSGYNSWGYGAPQQYYPGSQEGLFGVLRQNTSMKMPSFNTILLFLLAYLIFLVPVNFLVLRRKRRLELAWLTTPAIVIVFTIGAYAIGYTTMGGRLQYNEVNVIEGSSNARYASKITAGSLFSPARRSYDMGISDDFAVGQIVRRDENAPYPEVYLDKDSAIKDVQMAMWSSENFEVGSGCDLGDSIGSDMTETSGRLTGKIKMLGDINLRKCVLVYGQTVQTLPDLSRGSEAGIDVTFVPGNKYQSYYPQDTQMSERLRQFAISRARSRNAPYLIGLGNVASSRISTLVVQRAGQDLNSETVFVIRLDYRQ